MSDERLRVVGSILGTMAITLAVVRLQWPDLNIDNTTMMLLMLGALPWLLPRIKTLKLTGIGEIEFRQALQEMRAQVASIDTKVTEATETVAATQSCRHQRCR
jgi:hypothetical protein